MADILFIEYPKCSTCQKAKKWLEEHKIRFSCRHIVNDTPTADELCIWQKKSGKELRNFFNTSGLLYKSLNLKEKLPQMAENEQLKLLSANGMLIKRPLVVGDNFILIGFKEKEWSEKL